MDVWQSGAAYDRFMGPWSGLVADSFVDWLQVPAASRWVELGCGTGALTEVVVARCAPGAVVGVDPSPGLVERAAERFAGEPRVTVSVGEAAALVGSRAHVAVAGLVLNFVPDAREAVRSLAAACVAGGTVAAYVWDYPGEGMQMLGEFWAAAHELDASAGQTDHAAVFADWDEGHLPLVLGEAGLADVEGRAVEVERTYPDAEAVWEPFLGGTGTAPAYLAGLGEDHRDRLHDVFVQRLGEGPVTLAARAWAARGTVPAAGAAGS